MKIEFIKRGAETRLILLFAGWSTDSGYYKDCVVDGWDTAVVSDYRDLSMPDIPTQYSTIYIIAYSLGVWAASGCDIHAAARIAVCGSESPVSDDFGIPVAVFKATADNLTPASLKKFHLRMAGDKTNFARILPSLPSDPDIETLRQELYFISDCRSKHEADCSWDKIYIASADRIFPVRNLENFASRHPEAVKVLLDAPHALSIADIVKDVVPDTNSIGAGFASAVSTYNSNALVQSEICEKIGHIISRELRSSIHVDSLLEIGAGAGLLTEVWKSVVTPRKATYVDLVKVAEFGVAMEEEYVTADAEQWLENSNRKFDVILSASTVQWFADPVGFVRSLRKHLNPGGFAVIGTFVKGNLHELDSIRPCPILYKSSEDYSGAGAEVVEEWQRTLIFPSSREMLMHLKKTGVSPKTISDSTAINGKAALPLSQYPSELTYRPAILLVH